MWSGLIHENSDENFRLRLYHLHEGDSDHTKTDNDYSGPLARRHGGIAAQG